MVTKKSFVERYRSAIVGLGAIAVIVVAAAAFFIGSSQPAYACSIELTPGPTPAPGSPVTGQLEDDQGRTHVNPGTHVNYTYCPPASGNHYNVQGLGPIQPRFYSPDEPVVPMGWVHNLEHGGMVVLYNCAMGGCDTNSLDQLKNLVTTLPNSPRCGFQPGLISPVIARFDQMKAPFAAVVWNRVLFQDSLDVSQIENFYKTEAETTNPEPQCSLNMSSASPGASASPAPSGS